MQKILKSLHLWKFAYFVREFFYQLLRVDFFRALVAGIRYIWYAGILRRMRELDVSTGDIGVNTIKHNKQRLFKMKWLAVTRSNMLVYPLSGIRVTRSAPILSVGPRTEGELLNLMAVGFRNVRGLDLMSYSPWIDLGDMHAMPYKDDAFAAVVMGWCIAYSDNRPKAAMEAVRVSPNGGVIAVGVQYQRATAEEISQKVGYDVPDKKRIESVDEILSLFGNHVDYVYFRQDLPKERVDKWDLLVIFSVNK